MRQIKFRGLTLEGKFIYGDYRHIGFRPHIYKREQCYYEERAVEVAPESVAQLIGIDANGREVYEGDKVIRIAGDEDFNPEKAYPMAATFEDFAAIRDEEIILVEAVNDGRTDKSAGRRAD